MAAALVALSALALATPSHGALGPDTPEVPPADAKPGRVHAWRSADGLANEYRLPEEYDPEEGAGLTVVLHGNGLDHRWTFWNHPPDRFRAHDIVVSPDGTTPVAHTGANEFLGEREDVERVGALLEELRESWNVRRTYLYGHSQGSFFAFHYAGLRPDEVDGVCGHASGVWASTRLSRKGHHQAIGFLHGTNDANVPYVQSRGGAKAYRDAGYPLVHLRTLFEWPHRPNFVQAESVLSWCEGMVEGDPARVERCLEFLVDGDREREGGRDWSAAYAVARRLASMEEADEGTRKRAEKVSGAIEALAEEHAAAFRAALERGALRDLRGGAPVGHVARFLAELEGVPAREELLERHGKHVDANREAGAKAYAKWRKEREDDPRKASAAGLAMLSEGWLDPRVAEVLPSLETWAKEAREHRISRRDAKAIDELAATWRKGWEVGSRDFERISRKARP